MMLKVLTANRLLDGHPIWYDGNGEWSDRIIQAAIADTPDLCALFKLAGIEAMNANKVVCAELINVKKYQGMMIQALRLRERIRADGPTIGWVDPKEQL